jgi:hypothetical protein
VSEAANSNTKIEIQVSKYIPVFFIRENSLFLIH